MPLQIFVPFYGDPDLLRRTVTSVQVQTDPHWTLTVVDDGYPDPSVPAFFAGLSDPRIRYLRNDVNLGANGNFRRCLELADQDWLVLLGADDELLPDYVAVVDAAIAAHPDAAVVQPGVRVIDEHGRPATALLDRVKLRLLRPRAPQRRVLAGAELATSLLRGNWLYFPSLAFRREPTQQVGLRTGLDVVQDLALVLDLVMAGHSMVLDDTVCFAYRRHSASDSSFRALDGSRFTEQQQYFRQVADEVASLEWGRAARAGRWHLLSRIHALTLLPTALRVRQFRGAATLARHLVGRAS